MRQTFPFAHPKHKPAQALAALKNQVRKYLKRERRKPLPEGVDYWDFDCRIGPSEDAAAPVHVAEVVSKMDALAADGSTHVYVEILAKPGHRRTRPKNGETSASNTSASDTTAIDAAAKEAMESAGDDDDW